MNSQDIFKLEDLLQAIVSLLTRTRVFIALLMATYNFMAGQGFLNEKVVVGPGMKKT